MPWEKSFDLDDATDKAARVFWKKGYEATSLADLTDAMQINKGSLYNAFGSKKALFDRALARYDQLNRAARLAELRKMDDPIAAVDSFFQDMIDSALQDPECLGCFVINTAQDLPNQPPEVASVIRASLQDIEAFFLEMTKRAQADGSNSGAVPAEETAQGLLSVFVGMRVLSRGAVPPAAFAAMKASALRLLSPDA